MNIATFIKDRYVAFSNRLTGLMKGVNSRGYWDARFRTNWVQQDGRLQTTLFAVAFALLDEKFEAATILDYGCGCGDSLPVLKMRYPEAGLYYYDFSEEAMKKAGRYYSDIAKPLVLPASGKFDLVYCSNVVEHIEDPTAFCKGLVALAGKYVVVQAPYNERHPDGAPLSSERPSDEHVRTISEDFMKGLDGTASWEIRHNNDVHGWGGGQIFFIGRV